MNKKIVVLIAVLGVLAIAVIWGVSRYNAIITLSFLTLLAMANINSVNFLMNIQLNPTT